MQIRLATDSDQEAWNSFVLEQKSSSFFQLWEWGQVQQSFGLQVWRFVLEDDGIVAVMMVLRREAVLGRSWLYIPRGPVVADGREGVWEPITERLQKLAQEHKALFVRCDPLVAESLEGGSLLSAQGWRRADREVQPKDTIVLDLTLSDEELLAAMHSKTRYNIRLAGKKGVTTSFSTRQEDLDHFFALSTDVSNRSSFSFHPKEYYQAMLDVLGPVGMFEVAIAKHEEDVLAAHLIVYAGKQATYAHGASASHKRKLMAPALLQWETMRRARDKGCVSYDLFGVAPKGAGSDHSWSGITRFKEGFGGTRMSTIGAYDLVVSDSLYTLFNAARRVRGAIRS